MLLIGLRKKPVPWWFCRPPIRPNSPDAVERATGVRPALPERLRGIYAATENFVLLAPDKGLVRAHIEAKLATTMTPEISKLSNGLTVVTDTMPQLESAMLGVWVNAGAPQRDRSRDGRLAHARAHGVQGHADARSARDIAEEIETVGGYLNAYTSREQTAFHARVLKADVALGIDLLSDILTRPTFEQSELERERQVVLQELGQARDTPDDIIFRLSPIGELSRSADGLADPRHRRNCERLHAGSPAHLHGGAVSRRRHDLRLVRRRLACRDRSGCWRRNSPGLRSGPAPAPLPRALCRPARCASRRIWNRHTSPTHSPACRTTIPNSTPPRSMSPPSAGGMSSRLFQEARERRGLCYAISAFAQSASDSGTINVYTGTGAAEAAEVSAVIAGEMANLAAGATEIEVARAKAQMKSSLLMASNAPASAPSRLPARCSPMAASCRSPR